LLLLLLLLPLLLRPQALELLIEEVGDEDYSELRTALLDSDLRKTGAGGLPDDVNRTASSSLKGPLVLQVTAC
jgi:hypothetical protein